MRRRRLTRAAATPIRTGAKPPVTPPSASSNANRGPNAYHGSGARECGATLEKEVLEEGLAPSYWFEPVERGKPFVASIRFSGSREGVVGKPQSRDHFDHLATVEGILPGSGPISVTPQIRDINPGEWIVRAELSRKGQERLVRPYPGETSPGQARPRLWPRGLPTTPSGLPLRLKTGLPAFASRPGVITGAWPALVLSGFAVTLALQAVLLARVHIDVPSSLLVMLVASLAGLVGAKLWFVAQQPRPVQRGLPTQGLCIQGFLLGTAITAAAGLALLHVPIGKFLDATTPGLFFGMVVGRPGCFLTGCCAGRPTASRWGIWSSDGRIGVRRVPTQLLESLLSLGIGSAALLLDLLVRPSVPGAIFAAGLATYALGRQFLLPLRVEPRKSSLGRPFTIVAASGVLIADIVYWLATSLR